MQLKTLFFFFKKRIYANFKLGFFQSYQESSTQEEQETKQDEIQEQPQKATETGSDMPHSSTNDSLTDVAPAKALSGNSVTSSGYGSQAVSIQTLSSEDSSSVRSLEEVENDKNIVKTTQKVAPSVGSEEKKGTGEISKEVTVTSVSDGDSGNKTGNTLSDVDLLADIHSQKAGLTVPALLMDSDCPSNLGMFVVTFFLLPLSLFAFFLKELKAVKKILII